MLKFFRQLFKRKPKQSKTIEIVEVSEDNGRNIHNFNGFSDSNYCTILGAVDSNIHRGYDMLKIVWKSPSKIKTGDLIILSKNGETKTMRLLEVLSETKEEKIGIASALK